MVRVRTIPKEEQTDYPRNLELDLREAVCSSGKSMNVAKKIMVDPVQTQARKDRERKIGSHVGTKEPMVQRQRETGTASLPVLPMVLQFCAFRMPLNTHESLQ